MEITGRIVQDAEVRKTNNQKEVVSFTVVVNDYYKPKEGEAKEFEEYFNCSYWQGTKIADSLLKGSIVTVTGRVYLNQYKGKDGNHYANIAVHVSAINVIAKYKKNGNSIAPLIEGANAGSTKEDLPF